MASHKFRVGQMVDFNLSRVGVTASVQEYKILRLLPQGGGERLYAIKTIVEPFERVVKEGDLAVSTKSHCKVLQYRLSDEYCRSALQLGIGDPA